MPHQPKRIYTDHEHWLSLIYDQASDIDPSVIQKAIEIVARHWFHRFDARACTSFEVVE